MRRLLTFTLLAPLAFAGLFFGAPANADIECQYVDPETGLCIISVGTDPEPSPPPGGGNTGSSDNGSACYWDPAPQGLPGPPAGPVPCQSPNGSWSNQYHCYIARAKPQPPATDPAWAGHGPGDGAIYSCYQPQTDLMVYIWSANQPPASGVGPTPGEVAQLAIDQMNLHAIDIGIAPKPGADSVGLVGMPVWMWVADPDTRTFGPTTASASAGGVTVTATARVEKITWLMGDGSEVVCTTAGTPYQASFGRTDSPDCGHTYESSSAGQPNDRYTVTATSEWVVDWQGAGQSGTIRLDGLESSVAIAVGEAQVLVS